MALVLTVETARWRTAIERWVDLLGPRLVPVIKGNGYGFGRPALVDLVAGLGLDTVAVGTIDEVDPHCRLHQHVLTPCLDEHLDALGAGVTVTLGRADGARQAAEHDGPVAIKLLSSMRRHGVDPDELAGLLAELGATGRVPACFVLHLPLAGDDDDRRAEIDAWLPHLPGEIAVSVSHLQPESFARLTNRHPGRRFTLRVGTALWHAERDALHLGADVVAVRRVDAGTTAGYRLTPVPGDGSLVIVAAGSVHGVAPLGDGRSPLHYARTRLALLEPPHMHTTIAFVPDGAPCPRPGKVVDVQRPLTQVHPDRVVWLR